MFYPFLSTNEAISDDRGGRVRLHLSPESFAARHTEDIVGRVDGAWALLCTLIGETHRTVSIDVFLMDEVTESSFEAEPTRISVHASYVPDAPAKDLERYLILARLALDLGTVARPNPCLVDGLLALLMQRVRAFPDDAPLGLQLRQAKDDGRLPSLRALLLGAREQDVYYPAAASIVAFLLRSYGAAQFLSFLAALSTRTPEAAASQSFHHSLTRLEHAWRKQLARGRVGGALQFVRDCGPYLRPFRRQIAEILTYLALSVAFTIGLARMQGVLFDKALIPGDRHALATVIAILVGAFIVVLLTSLRQTYLTAYVSGNALRAMNLRVYKHLQRQDHAYFDHTQSGDILSRMTSDAQVIELALGGSVAQGVRFGLTVVAATVTIVLTDWRLAVVALAGTPLFYLVNHMFGPPFIAASRARQEKVSMVTANLQENLSARPVVKAFGLEARATAEYERGLAQLFQSTLRAIFLQGVYGLASSSVALGIQLVVLGVGAYLVIGGSLTLGTLVAFLALVVQIIAPLLNVSSVVQSLQQASVAMVRVNELLDSEPTITDAPDAGVAGPLESDLRLQGITFGYLPAEPILRDVTLDISAGANIALVGPSGCGKSTVMSMIMRFYDPQAGQVLFNGVDIRTLTLASVRSQIGLVLQDTVLFNMSLRENIRLGRLEATDAEVESAARAAELHEFLVELPSGYDTVVGERGSRLSGGQRQRVAIARAVLRDPRILLLDEATSALDSRTEASINSTLRHLGAGRTTISVTHRLSSVTDADRIYVLDGGRIVEEGRHEELLELRGLYRQLWEEQVGGPGVLDAERLRAIPLFADLGQDILATLATHLTTEEYAARDIIVRQGDLGDRLYLLLQGQVEVLSSDPVAPQRPLAVLGPGDYFGEVALIQDTPRIATVRARTVVSLYTLSREHFDRLLIAVPLLAEAVEQIVKERVQATAEAASR